MKTLLALALLFTLATPAFAFETQLAAPDYDTAEKAASYLRFTLNTKKMGIFKSKVTGYAKKFQARGKIEGLKLRDAAVTFPVRELDTDLYARNDQMWNYCLGYKENPEVKITLPALAFGEGKAQTVSAVINTRGKDHPLPLEIKLEKKNGRWVASGSGHASFAQLEIPDPSIGVASVDGDIMIEFSLEDAER